MTEIYIQPATYRQHSDMFEGMPPNLIIVVEFNDFDEWHVERVEGGDETAKAWITFITEWLDDRILTDEIEKHALRGLEVAIADWGADRSDYAYETWRDDQMNL